MSTAPRKPAQRLARPAARYWKGKAPKGVADVQSDSDEDDDQVGKPEVEVEQPDEDEELQEFGLRPDMLNLTKGKGMNIALKDVNVSKEGKVIVAGREESGRTALEEEETSSEEEEEDDDNRPTKPGRADEEEEESSEEESESDEEKVEFRPVFVPKRSRVTVAEREALAQDTEDALQKKAEAEEERRKESHDLVAQTIRRELAEKEKDEEIVDVDDTDGLDPEAEFEAWRLRELSRIKMEKEAEVAREKVREEVERRRALPEEQRMREDLEHAQKLREEKPKGSQKFLQKYWHKGAFHQDDEILRKHDYTAATESTMDVSMLPAVMQVKNFGKRSRTKYTHLVDQDTTVKTGGFGGQAPVKSGGTGLDGAGCFLCGGPHMKKDCPRNNESGRPTGANAAQSQNMRFDVGREPRNGDDSSWKARGDSSRGGWRDRDGVRDDYRGSSRQHDRYHDKDRDDHRDRDRDRERYGDKEKDGYRDRGYSSRDSRKNYDDYRPRRRSRDRSRSVEGDSRDKRRRID